MSASWPEQYCKVFKVEGSVAACAALRVDLRAALVAEPQVGIWERVAAEVSTQRLYCHHPWDLQLLRLKQLAAQETRAQQ